MSPPIVLVRERELSLMLSVSFKLSAENPKPPFVVWKCDSIDTESSGGNTSRIIESIEEPSTYGQQQ